MLVCIPPEPLITSSPNGDTNASTSISRAYVEELKDGQSTDHQISSIAMLDIPWNIFPARFLDACKANKCPDPSDRREMIRIMAEAIDSKKLSPKRHEIRQIAEKLVQKYPGSLGDKCGTGKVYDSIFLQLENRLMNIKRSKKSLGNLFTDDNNQEEVIERNKSRKSMEKDSYGCVSWQPNEFPPSETLETLKEKQRWLKNQHSITDHNKNSEKISEFMNLTYVLQRNMINKKDPPMSIEMIKEEWPFLFETKHLISHCIKLLGKNLESTITVSCEKYFKKIMAIISRNIDWGNADTILNGCVENKGMAIVENCLKYFKEDSAGIFKLYDVGSILFVIF